MSPKLNWVDGGGKVVSPIPCTALTMGAILRDVAGTGNAGKVTVKNETTIEIDGAWGKVTLKGVKP